MEYIIEFILELCFEIGVEASKSNRVPKYVRYLLITIISLTFISLIGLIIFMGITILKNNLLGGIIIILLGLVMLVSAIFKFKKLYLQKNNSNCKL